MADADAVHDTIAEDATPPGAAPDDAAPAVRPPAPGVPRLCGDVHRAWVAVGASLPVALGVVLALQVWRGQPLPLVASTFLVYDLYAATYLVLTLRVFGAAAPGELGERVAASRSPHGPLVRALSGGSSGLGGSVQLAVVALVAAALLPRLDGLVPPGGAPLATALGVVAVAASWASVAVSYAVEYARVDTAEGGLSFPGGAPLEFRDYLYLGMTVSSTFGTTDVTVTTTRMRRLVYGQAVLTFVFNTVIVALLVAALVG